MGGGGGMERCKEMKCHSAHHKTYTDRPGTGGWNSIPTSQKKHTSILQRPACECCSRIILLIIWNTQIQGAGKIQSLILTFWCTTQSLCLQVHFTSTSQTFAYLEVSVSEEAIHMFRLAICYIHEQNDTPYIWSWYSLKTTHVIRIFNFLHGNAGVILSQPDTWIWQHRYWKSDIQTRHSLAYFFKTTAFTSRRFSTTFRHISVHTGPRIITDLLSPLICNRKQML